MAISKEEYKALRESLGISQEKMAAKLGIVFTTYSKRERGISEISYEAELAIKEIVRREKQAAAKTKSITTEN